MAMANDTIGSVTMPCNAGCGTRGPVAQTVKAYQVPTAKLANGNTINEIDLSSVPRRDALGRIAHVIGFTLVGSAGFTCADGTSEAVPGLAILRKMYNFFLRDSSGHQYLAGVDAIDMVRDRYFRNWRMGPHGVGCTGLDANAGAGAQSVAFQFFFPLVPQSTIAGRGMVPLAALQDADPNGLEFTIRATPGTYTDVTDTGMDSPLQVWLHLLYLPTVDIKPAWQLQSYTKDDVSGKLYHGDRAHEYVAIAPWPEDATISLVGLDGITFNVGSDVFVKGMVAADFTARETMLLAQELYGRPDISWQESNQTDQQKFPDYTDGQGNYGYRLPIPRSRFIENAPAGIINYQFASLGSNSYVRYLHRTVLCQDRGRIHSLLRSALSDCRNPDERGAVVLDDAGQLTDFTRNPFASVSAR